MEKEIKIKLLEFPDCVREKVGMYVGGADDATVIFREIIDNSMDEAYSSSCDRIYLHQNFNGFHLVADNGRGLPITMSEDKPDQTQASLAVGSLHAGSKFDGSSSGDAKIGTNGVGSSCTNALSEKFVVLSRITKSNYDKSIPQVKSIWDSTGPRSRGDLFYYLEYNRGIKVTESAGHLHDLESNIFDKKYKDILPDGYNTYILFKPDPTIFDSVKSKVPTRNLEYFMLIQEKFYHKHVDIIVNGKSIADTYPRYKYEVCKTIIPADTSKNDKVGFYMTFEVDPNLGGRDTMASCNGLCTDQGHHVQIAELCYKDALIRNYNITHSYLLNALRMVVVVICKEAVFDSQTKVRLKSIVKVKSSDFEEVTKEIMKVFRSDPDYWDLHVQKLNAYADSMVSLSTMDRIKKDLMKTTTSGIRGKAFLPDKLSDATAGSKDRMKCELFLCFTGDTEVITSFNEYIKFTDLIDRLNSGEEIYTISRADCVTLVRGKIVRAQQTGIAKDLVKVTLDNDRSFRCTLDHKIMLPDSTYKEAKDLKVGEKLMPAYVTRPRIVKSIEFLNDVNEPVYCLEVDNECHNFPIGAGVYVHNCEGDSAGGSLKSGRKSTLYHAVMPLKGRTLNTINKTIDQVLDNKELNTIFQAIGLGVDSYNIASEAKSKEEKWELIRKHARYGKIVISTDSDDDGAIIAAILISTFGQFSRFLIEFGMLYLIESPIYEQGGRYFYPSDKMPDGSTKGFIPSKPYVRFKGLGELNKNQIYDAFFDPSKRRLIRVTTEGIEKALELVRSLDERKKLLEENGILTNPYNLK